MAAHLRRAALAVALLLSACSSAHAASDVLGPGSWTGARTTRDPKVVLITFVGGAPYRRGNPCTTRYRATAVESATTVAVRFTATSPKGHGGITACNAVGYHRSVRLRLSRPLGDRKLVEAAFHRTQPAFDGTTLLRPTWLPRHYRVRYESGADGTWTRTWRLPIPPVSTSDRCTPSRPPIELTEGPAAAVIGSRRIVGLTLAGRRPVRGTTATLSRGSNALTFRLEWREGDRGFSLATMPTCVDDRPITEAQLLRFAAGLRPKP